MQEPVMNQPLYPLHQAAAQPTVSRRPLRRSSQLLPLEQRFMFDGAVASAVADSAHAAEAAAAAAAAAAVPPAVTVRAADPGKDQGKKEVVLVDTSLADYKTLEAGLRDGVGIVEFDGGSDGLAQIAAWAATQSGLDAIHILSHGSDGTLELGTNHLTEASLASAATQAELAELGLALSADGDLLLYGCDVGAGDGTALLAGVARATGADVAASTNLTGASKMGGDWTLESHTGSIEARELVLTDYAHVLQAVDVTTGYTDGDTTFTKTADGVTVTFTVQGSTADGAGFYNDSGGVWPFSATVDNDGVFTITVPAGYSFDLTSVTGIVDGSVTYHPTYVSGAAAVDSTHNGTGGQETYTLSNLNAVTQVTVSSTGNGTTTLGYMNFMSLSISVHALAPATTVTTAALGNGQDTGSSPTDFYTNYTGVSTISGSLSAALTSTQKVQVSYDGGSTWSNATSYATGSASWSTAATLSGSNTFEVRVAETYNGGASYFGGTAKLQSYTVDTTAPTTTFSNIAFNHDNGSNGTDLVTNVATQNISATLSLALTSGDTVWASSNGGGSYTDVTSFVSGTTLNWTGQTLSGSSALAFKVTDKAGNDSTPTTHTYTIDTTAPTAYATSVALSADSGTPGDLITKTAAQTISGTLSASLGASETVYVSVASGAWTAASTTGTNWSLAGQTLTGSSDSIRVKVTDLAGNDGNTVYSATYTLDTTGPAITFSNVHLNSDTGGDSTDFITSVASQSIIATLSAAPAGSDIVYGSIDNGASWTNITSMLSGTTLTWTGVTLSGNSSIWLKVTDNAANDGTVYSHTYIIDASAPAAPAAPTLDSASASDTGASNSDKVTNDTTPTLSGTAESGSTVTVYDGATLLGTVVATGGSWSYTTTTLSGGSHSFTATATDTAGNVSAASSGLAVTIDATAPVVSSVSVPAAGVYAAGSTLTFIVHADENVYVNTTGGTPSLTITIGGTSRSATYALGSGSGDLVFAYTVQAGETDTDGIAINGLSTNGGTLTDTAGNTMSTTLHSVGATNNVLVDTTAPVVSSVGVSADGTYYSGEAIQFTVNFGENVTVNTSGGTPSIAITIGSSTRYATYVSGSGGSALTFAYTAANGDIDTDGITVGALALNSGTIKDAAGNNAVLTLHNVASTANIDVDGSSPSITGVDATTGDGYYAATNTITITVNFSTAVTVDTTGGTPTLALDTGAAATYTGGSGTATLTFSYTVAAGQNSADLDYSSTAALALNGATIVDAGGAHRAATLTLATPGVAGSLGGNRAIVIDTTAPTNTIDSVSFTPDNGAYNNDLVTNTGAVTVSGTLVANLAASEHVYVSFDNGITYLFANDSTGSKNWSVTLLDPLSDSDTVKVLVMDDAGNLGSYYTHTYTIDTVAPTISFSNLSLSADHGASSTDFLTDTGAQTVNATLSTAPAGTDVVYGSVDGGATWTDITSKVSGTSVTWTGATLVGSNTLMLKVTDLAGNDGAVASQAYVIDATPPGSDILTVEFDQDSGASPTDFITNVAAQTVQGTLTTTLAAGERVLVSLDNGATWATAAVTATNWSLAGRTLTASDTLLVKVSSAAGADSAVLSQAYVYDTAATRPNVTAQTSSSLTPTIAGTATLGAGETMTVTVGGATYDVVPVAGAWSLDLATAVPVSGALTLVLNNQYNVTATVTDLAGNTASDATTGELIVGTIAPPVPPPPTTSVSGITLSNDSGASSTDFITNVAQQTISGGLSAPLLGGESVQVSVDGGANWSGASASGSSWSLNATLSGSNTILVRVIGAGGVGAAAGHAYTLDTSAPATPVVDAQSGSALAPVLSGAATLADGETLNVTVGGASYAVNVSGGHWSLDLASATPASGVLLLAAGNSYSVVATITDLAGNQSSASNDLTIAALPQVTGAALSADSGASSSDFITNVAAQTVSGTLSAPLTAGQTVEISVDNGATWTSASTSASSWNASVTLSGSNTLLARVTSAAGKSTPYSHAYVLDNTAPVAAPGNAVVTTGGNVSGTLSAPLAAGDTLQASRDGGATWTVIASSDQAWTLSSDGASSVQLQVRDLAGNAGATLTVNTAQTPEPPVTTDPPLPPALPETPPVQPVAPILPVAPINPGAPATVAGTPADAPVAGAGAGSGQPAAPLVLPQTSVGGDIATSWPGQTPPTVLDTLPSSVVLQAPDFDRAPLNNSFQIVALPALQGGGTLVAYNPIADVRSTSGERISVQVGSDAFAQSGSNANVELTAQSADGSPLPGWLRFDGRTARFEGTPPAGFEGTLNFKVIARDSQGRVATQVFKIVISKDGAKSSWHGEPAEPAGRAGLNEQLRNARSAGMARLAALSS
jgi:hypothetical protein